MSKTAYLNADICTQPFYSSGFCLGQPGWAGTKRNIHLLILEHMTDKIFPVTNPVHWPVATHGAAGTIPDCICKE